MVSRCRATAAAAPAASGRAAATSCRALATDDATLPHSTRSDTGTCARTAATTGASSPASIVPSTAGSGHGTIRPAPPGHHSHGPAPPGRQCSVAAIDADPVARPPGGPAAPRAPRRRRTAARRPAPRCPWNAIDAATRAAGAQRRADGGDPVRERAVRPPRGRRPAPSPPRAPRCPWPPRRTARCPRRRRAGRARPAHDPSPRPQPCHRAHTESPGARPFGWAAACPPPPRRVSHGCVPRRSVASLTRLALAFLAAPRATLVGAKTARGAACGRTRTQADRCPHQGVPDWPTAVRQ